MATNVAYLSNSPHSLTLRLTGDGVAATPTRAAILAECAEGPLKTLLSRVADWSEFNLGGPRGDEIHVRNGMCCTVDAGVPGRAFVFTALGATVNASNGGNANIEILMQHSERF
jgi:hypothetical protein